MTPEELLGRPLRPDEYPAWNAVLQDQKPTMNLENVRVAILRLQEGVGASFEAERAALGVLCRQVADLTVAVRQQADNIVALAEAVRELKKGDYNELRT